MDAYVEGMRSMLETAWDRVASEISGAEETLAIARRPWIDAFAEGRETRRIERTLRDNLLRSHWDWPWHREWFDRFSAMRAWPCQWGSTSRAVYRLERDFPEAETSREREDLRRAEIQEIEENAIRLLTQTIFKFAFTERDRQQRDDARFLSYLRRMGGSFELRSDEPAAIAELFVDPHRDAFAALYPSLEAPMPPFFPGDSTDIRFIPRKLRSAPPS
ncbi:hypothetical protein [Pinisolibacter sp.]|uniref:hypothetical protein n=1 Tax=Pinisolibacter sp. TaxID=2172024 RepID=UPI002FDEC714